MAREVYELRVNCNSSIKRVSDLKDCLNINSLLSEIEKLEAESNKDDFWNDTKNAKQVLKTLNKNKQKKQMNRFCHIASVASAFCRLLQTFIVIYCHKKPDSA